MKVYYCNINRINEEIEDFVIAKNKIEQPLIDEEKIEKKMSIKEFLEYIDLSHNIFINNDTSNISIPFYMKYVNNELVVIYSLDDQIDKYDKIFKENLEKINFDINSLSEVSEFDMINGKLKDKPYYIINNKFRV